MSGEQTLEVRGLSVRQRESGQCLVGGVSFSLARGACLGIVGESGSGKTLTCRSILGLLPPTLYAEGSVLFRKRNVLTESEDALRSLRGSGIAMILQQPMTAFDPLYTIGEQFKETLAAHKLPMPLELLSPLSAGLPECLQTALSASMRRYPHELSGGMLQRAMTAFALALQPELIVADEPTTALDAESQYEVLQAFLEMRRQRKMSLIVVSHDFGVVQRLADTIMVMRGGLCVEYGPAARVLNAPQHPHTQELVRTRRALSRAFVRVGGG